MHIPSEIAYLLENTVSAIETGDVDEALRFIDRARRLGPSPPLLRLLYAKALLSAGHLEQAAANIPVESEPSLNLIKIEALFRLGDRIGAGELCKAMLFAYAVDAIDGLAALASQLCKAPESRWPGWVGIDSKMRLIGETSTRSPPIASSGAEIFTCVRQTPGRSDLTAFEVSIPRNFKGCVDLHVDGLPLLGSGAPWPPEFGALGWVALHEREICGEARVGWAPGMNMTLIVEAGEGQTLRAILPASDGGQVGAPFSIPLAWTGSDAETLTCALALPDGRRRPLSGSPLSRLNRPAPTGWRSARSRAGPPSGPVDVIVPIYAGYEETLACLQRVLVSTTPAECEIVVVDDASPDEALVKACRALADDGKVTLLTNRSNRGFPGAVNRGLALHPDRDVVILNADTEVFHDWLARLKRAAYRANDIATVTPFGNAASIVSYPGPMERQCTSEDAELFDDIARAVNGGLGAELPVGVGFCLYVRRACLDEVGFFDEIAFGRGYGEENDLCLRAQQHGWRHVLAADVFVRHKGGRSFAAEKAALMARNRRVLVARHPDFETAIERFRDADPLLGLRRAMDAERLRRTAERPVVILTTALPGGVARFVDGRRAELVAVGHTVITVRPADFRMDNDQIVVNASHGVFESLAFRLETDLSQLEALLRTLPPYALELHHFLGHDFPLLEKIIEISASMEIYTHDYAWVCPRLTLLSGKDKYCGEPPIEDCEACIGEHGSMLNEIISVRDFRERNRRLLSAANRIVAPTDDTRSRLQRYFPNLAISTLPWETTVPKAQASTTAKSTSSPRIRRRRIGVLGALSWQKGYRVLLECAKDAAARDLPLEFVVIGYTRDDAALFATGRVFVTGRYEEDELAHLLDREDCAAFFFASLTPETWCYALTPTLSLGRPIVAFEIGAIAERLRRAGVGVLIPLETPTDAINSILLRVMRDGHDDLVSDVLYATVN